MELNTEKLYVAQEGSSELIVDDNFLNTDNSKLIHKKLLESGFNLPEKYQKARLGMIPLSNNRKFYEFIIVKDLKGGLTDNIFTILFFEKNSITNKKEKNNKTNKKEKNNI